MSVVPQYNMRTGWGRGPDRAALLSACFLTLLVVTTLEPPTSHVLASGTRNMRESFMTIFISKHGERNSALYPSPPPTPPDTYLLVVKARNTGWPILGVLRKDKKGVNGFKCRSRSASGACLRAQKPRSFLSDVTKPLPMTAMWTVLSPSAWPVGWEESTQANAQAAKREICPVEHL